MWSKHLKVCAKKSNDLYFEREGVVLYTLYPDYLSVIMFVAHAGRK